MEAARDSDELDHSLVMVDEFDALSIVVDTPSRMPPTVGNRASSDEFDLDHAKLGKYPAKTHARKVAKKLGVKSGIIYLPGQEEKFYEDSDMGPEFRQRRHFYYMAGADFPGCAVTYDIEDDYLVLWIPRIEPRKVLWYGRTPSLKQCKAASEVDDVQYITDLKRTLCSVLNLKATNTIYALHPDQVPRLDCVKGTVHFNTTKLKPAIDRARVIKTDHEIALIRRANAISSAAHKAVLTSLKHCRNERDVHALFLAHSLTHRAKHQSYPIIAASGANASTLHYTDNDQPLTNRQLLLLDAGAEYACYASDVTRTLPLAADGRFSREAAAVYRIVERMQEECIAFVRPGVAFHCLHSHAAEVAVRGLLRLGVLRDGSAEEILRRGTVAAFFPHGLGHHVGLEVHDVSGGERLLPAVVAEVEEGGRAVMVGKREVLSAEQMGAMYEEDALGLMRNGGEVAEVRVRVGGGQKLEKGMVVTIEPGIYFCREYIEGYFRDHPIHSQYINWEELDKYWDVGGVRIEDDILVTEDGYENLTWAPKGETVLQACEHATQPLTDDVGEDLSCFGML